MTLITRRSILRGLIAAPVVITTPGLLMRVRSFEKPLTIVYVDVDKLLIPSPWPDMFAEQIMEDISRAMNIPLRYLVGPDGREESDVAFRNRILKEFES